MCRLRNIALESVTDKVWQTDRQTDDGQSDPFVSLCFAGDTKIEYVKYEYDQMFDSTTKIDEYGTMM